MGITRAQTTNNVPVNDIINPNFLLLDTCSTISYINNEDFVKDILSYDAGEELWAYENMGHQYYSYTTTTTMIFSESFTKTIVLQT